MANTTKVGLILSATDKMSRVVSQAVSKSQMKMKKLEAVMAGVNSVSNKMFVAGGVAAAGLWKSIDAAEDSRVAVNRLKNAYKQMWNNSPLANKAAEDQLKYASKLAMQIGVEDEIIALTQAKIATFKNVSSQTAVMTGLFDRATVAAHDMAAGGFGEAATNAVALGKALNDPMNGAAAMKKAGTLDFGDVALVKQIQLTKGLGAAQEYILKAVERQFKGTAEATAKSTSKIKVGFGEVVESIGMAFLPAVDKTNVSVSSLFLKVTEWIGNNHKLIKTIAKIGIGLIAATVAIRTVTLTIKLVQGAIAVFKALQFAVFAVQYATTGMNLAFLASPLFWIPAIILAVVAAVVICWKKFAGFRAVILTVWDTVKGFGNILKDFVLDRIKGIITGLGSMGKAISLVFHGKFAAAYDEAKKGVKALNGYDAKVKAMQNSAALVSNISTRHREILAVERSKDASKTQPASTAVMIRKPIAANQQVTYSPTIIVQGNASKSDIEKVSQDSQKEFARQMKKWNLNLARTTY